MDDDFWGTLIFGAIIIGAIIYGVVLYWYIIIPSITIVIAIAIYFSNKAKEEKRRTEYAAEQGRYLREIVALCDGSIEVFESLPNFLDSAEKHLNQAEVDFDEGVFAPFWDSIEKATTALSHFDRGIQKIIFSSSQYMLAIKKYNSSAPELPVSAESAKRLAVGLDITDRMKKIIRRAQSNPDFAKIYEMRRTNQLLVAGFSTLGEALQQISQNITTSINDLKDSVSDIGSRLEDQLTSINSKMQESAEREALNHRQILKESSKRKDREKKVLEMLDNIQHHRRPPSI